MFTLLTFSSNNKFPPEDAKPAVLRKLGSTKNNPGDFINLITKSIHIYNIFKPYLN